MGKPSDNLFDALSQRYHGTSPDALKAVMCPLLIPIESIDDVPIQNVFTESKIHKGIETEKRKKFWKVKFTVKITPENSTIMAVGRTGKFVPGTHVNNGEWRELAKGRLTKVDFVEMVAEGEVYTGDSQKQSLLDALANISERDLWEVDQYGASAKILSALAEHFLVEHGRTHNYRVTRMPEDMARHLGSYANYDFQFTKNGKTLGVEAKSIWGTNTNCARLIHSKTTAPKGDATTWSAAQTKNFYATSSCKFDTQDIFAVNLFLRTGNIRDFAFARSVSNTKSIHGLPAVPGYAEHVTQNPACVVDGIVWFGSINEVWDLL